MAFLLLHGSSAPMLSVSPSPAKKRRGWDSNPRIGGTYQRFSRPSRSTTLPPLRAFVSEFTSLTQLIDDVVGDEDRDIDGDRQCDRVAWPGVDFDQLSIMPDA